LNTKVPGVTTGGGTGGVIGSPITFAAAICDSKLQSFYPLLILKYPPLFQFGPQVF
jgi:hypothetical protein